MSVWAVAIGAAVGIANGVQQNQNSKAAQNQANAMAFQTANENTMAMMLEQLNNQNNSGDVIGSGGEFYQAMGYG